MTTRITGLATGLDVDTIVKQTMQAYRTKIDTQQQKKDVTEIKQQLYRDIIKEAQELYNTHFDVLKSGSLVRAATWQSVKFESNSTNLTVTGDASAKVGNYTIKEGSTIAKAASISKTEEELGSSVIINGQSFNITGNTAKEKAINLNNELSKAGINVSVKYTDFAGSTTINKQGFLFESKLLGKDNNFIIGGKKSESLINSGTDATGAEITGITIEDLKENIDSNSDSNSSDDIKMGKVNFEIGEKKFEIYIAESSEKEDIEKILNSAISKNGYTAKIADDGKITFITIETGANQLKPESIKIKQGESDNYITINIDDKNFIDGKDATSASLTTDIGKLDKTLLINGVVIDFTILGKEATNKEKIDYTNKILEEKNISIKASIDGENIILESSSKGSNSKIDFSYVDSNSESKIEVSNGGQDAKIIVSNGSGSFTHTGNTNNFTVDGIKFDFVADIPEDGIKITSKQDSKEIVDKIKSYIDDYNKLMVKINTLTSEKRDRNYQPLTKEQKAEMSDKEIELWESKVKQGQLKNDSDLTRIANSLRQGMSTMVSGSGLTLKDIGIESVQDYGGTKDGTFKINEATLKEAIESNTEAVSKLFMQSAPSGTSENDAYSKKGIMMRLKDILYDETVSSKSILAQKVGFEGTTTVANNALTKQMTEYQKKIDQMESLFSTKEQDLYSKYAKLETIISSYNNQMNYLSQSLGLSS